MNSKLLGIDKKDIDFETDMSKPSSEIMTTDLIGLQIVHHQKQIQLSKT